MSREPIRVNSESWTGKLPEPVPRKPVSPSRFAAGALIFAVASFWALWTLLDGLWQGRMRVPFVRAHRFVTADDTLSFCAGAFGWLLLVLLLAFSSYAMARAVQVSRRATH